MSAWVKTTIQPARVLERQGGGLRVPYPNFGVGSPKPNMPRNLLT